MLANMGISEIEACYLIPASQEIEKQSQKPEETGAKNTSAETEMPAVQWEREEYPELLFQDADLAQVCSGVKEALKLTYEGIVFLAIPLSPYEPFPAMPIFCFGESLTIAGKDYIVFKIKNGKLC